MVKGYYEYDPVIYPRLLWVAIGVGLKDLKEAFDELPDDDDGVEYNGVVYERVSRKSDGAYGILACFPSRKVMTMSVLCHEASHIVDAIEEQTGIKHGGEPSAYLIGWVAKSLNEARLNIGNFIKIEEK
jgi:hypothetical protein